MSEMGRCRDCRWWSPDRAALDQHDLYTRYLGEAQDGFGYCLQTWTDNGTMNLPSDRGCPDTLAVCVETDSNPAVLTTSPKFGCVQFEAKMT